MAAGIVAVIYFIVWISNWLVYYHWHIFYLTTFSLFCGLALIAGVLYDGSMWKKLIAVAASIAFVLVVEEITWHVFNVLGVGMDNEAAGSLWSTLLALGILLLIDKCRSYDKSAWLPAGSYLNLFLMAVGNIILTYLSIEAKMSHVYAVIALSVLCLINISMYSLYESVAEAYRNTAQAAAMKQQAQMYANQCEVINQSQQNIRSLKHDIQNHLLNISTYLQNEKYDDVKEYIARMENALEAPGEYVRTGNLGIDGIMNYKLERIQALGCVPEVKIDVPKERFMSDFDLTVIMGNLLDNMIEALEKDEKKFISIAIRYIKGVLHICMCNSYRGELTRKGSKWWSSKKDKANHGIGLYNVENIVKKYNGKMEIHHHEGIYQVDIIMYIQ